MTAANYNKLFNLFGMLVHLSPRRNSVNNALKKSSSVSHGWGRPQHAVSKLPCLGLSSAISCCSSICPGRLSTAWLVSLVAFSCHMVSKWWHTRSIGCLWGGWYALPRIISFFSQCTLYLWRLSSPWPRYCSFYLCMWCWPYFFQFWSMRPLVCSVLVWSAGLVNAHQLVRFRQLFAFTLQ